MKILQIDVNYDHSSTGSIVKDLKIGMERNGHSIKACYGRKVKNLESEAIKISPWLEVYAHAALTRLTGRTGIFSPLATRNCIALMEAFQPDVVHLHELHGYYLNIGEVVDYLKKKKIPTLWTFHCEFMYTGKCGYAFDCERWKSGCGECPQLSDYPASLFLDRTRLMFRQKQKMFEGFDRLKIITPSKWLADRARQSHLHDKDIDAIYNGIDTEIFQPRDTTYLRKELGINTKYIIVSAAPDLMSERKGGRWVLELSRRMANEDVTFVMVGIEKPEAVTEPNVIAMPRVSDKILLSKLYALGDLFLLTSKKETFSLVCAESLACGTPIIGFDAGAPTEVAPNGFGHFVDYGNLDLLHSVATHALLHPDDFQSTDSCKNYAVKNFGKDQMIDAYLSAYNKLLTTPNGNRF